MPFSERFSHPVFQYATASMTLVLALVFAAWSASLNPHSLTWLVGTYLTAILLMMTLRKEQASEMRLSLLLYLCTLISYLMAVWMLHVTVPAQDFEAAKADARFWLRWLGGGGIYLSVALFRFTLRFSGAGHRYWRRLEATGWVVGIAFHVTQLSDLFFGDFLWTGHTWVATMTGFYPFFFGYTTLFVTLGLAVPLAQVFRTDSRRQRVRLYFFLAGAVPLWLSCWSHFLISLGVRIYPAGGIFLSFIP